MKPNMKPNMNNRSMIIEATRKVSDLSSVNGNSQTKSVNLFFRQSLTNKKRTTFTQNSVAPSYSREEIKEKPRLLFKKPRGTLKDSNTNGYEIDGASV